MERLRSLTQREREVMVYVVAGYTKKEIARRIGAIHRPVGIGRAHLRERMAASKLAELVRRRLLVDERLH